MLEREQETTAQREREGKGCWEKGGVKGKVKETHTQGTQMHSRTVSEEIPRFEIGHNYTAARSPLIVSQPVAPGDRADAGNSSGGAKQLTWLVHQNASWAFLLLILRHFEGLKGVVVLSSPTST